MHGEPSAEALAKALGGKRAGKAYKARCPCHDDAVASLAIGTKGGRTVFRCHAGCDQKDVLAALRKNGHWPELNGADTPKPIIVATYDYRDEQGELLFQSIRYVPKDFRQRRPNGGGGWTWNTKGVRVVPYRLPELIEAIANQHPVFVVEGEKDADSLAKLGIAATCNVAGAGKWRAEHAAFLKGADVVIVPDNDEPGREHAEQVAKSLSGFATRVRLLRLPNLPDKGDVFDWIVAGGTADRLWRLVELAPDWSEGADSGLPRPITLRDFMRIEFPAREMVLGPIVPEKGLAMIYASRGIGKTHTGLGCAYAVATGGEFLRWKAPKSRRVLYIDGEMAAGELQERLHWTMNGRSDTDLLEILCSDAADGQLGNLATPQAQTYVDSLLNGASLLVLDSLSTLTNASENDPDAWLPIQGWMLQLRRRGISVLLIHHAGKGGEQRGTSKREDVLNTSISLVRPSDYTPEQGARFEVHYKKARGILGGEVKPFEAWLKTDGLSATWAIRDVDIVVQSRVKEMMDLGMSVRDIAEAVGVPKSSVHRIKQQIEEEQKRDAARGTWEQRYDN